MTRRRPIKIKDAKPPFPSRATFLFLPGELRNKIYALCFDVEHSRVPLNPFHLNKPDQYIALARTYSQMYGEVRGYMTENQAAYIPVMVGMNFDYEDKLDDEFGLTIETKDTIAAALTEFANVHFHLHVDLIAGENSYDPRLLLASLHRAIETFQSQSMRMLLRSSIHSRRRATVHLDHFLSLWPKLHPVNEGVPGGELGELVELLAKDRATDWEIRYYIPTGQGSTTTTYGNYRYDGVMIRELELTQLLNCVRQSRHGNISVIVEMYGEHTTWNYGDKTGCVVRHRRTPAIDLWPNLHSDPALYDSKEDLQLLKLCPTTFSSSNFDPETLDALKWKLDWILKSIRWRRSGHGIFSVIEHDEFDDSVW
ncbi:hypothetical protein Ptr902_11937 [Pyrenophora tritici-repentis]|nr:hypothetical protein Ptr902_11937 [Pyrenophora tritici-repentis]